MEEHTQRRRTPRQSPVQKNRSLQGTLLTVLLFGTVVLFVVLGLLVKDRTFSESENRNLAQAPELSWSAVTDGSYLSDLSAYVADQFPGRDMWMSMNLWLQKLFGSKESGGVYLCQDDYLMQVPGEPNEEQLERNLAAMDRFSQAYPEITIAASIAPNAVTVMAEKLPKNAPVRDQRADLKYIQDNLKNVRFVDVTDTLIAHNEEQLYYRTDHHWTSLAAAYAFEDVAQAMGVTAPALNTYDRYLVSNTFEGTLSSKSGSHKAADTVEIFVPKTDIEYYVTYPDGGGEICSMYNREALDGKDHYTVFFGGNYSRVDITTSADTGRSLLIFKDSYANCMIQFLYPYFDHITMVDPRYFYDNVENIITSENVTDVLFLYNLDTFLSDTSLADVITVD